MLNPRIKTLLILILQTKMSAVQVRVTNASKSVSTSLGRMCVSVMMDLDSTMMDEPVQVR